MTTMTSLHSGTWTIQTGRAQFTARGLFGHAVVGTIDVVDGTIEIDANHHPRHLHVTLNPASLNTGHPRRDKDLRGKRFLDVDANPAMSVDADLISLTPHGWHCRATLYVAGTGAPLLIRAELDGTATDSFVRARGTSRLDLREADITVPSLLVRRYVDLTVSAELLRTR